MSTRYANLGTEGGCKAKFAESKCRINLRNGDKHFSFLEIHTSQSSSCSWFAIAQGFHKMLKYKENDISNGKIVPLIRSFVKTNGALIYPDVDEFPVAANKAYDK